jgi:hypothetical protein
VAFIDLVSELSGTLPGLSPILARTFINRAWEKIRTAKSWSFLVSDAAVVCPAVLNAGTAAIVQYTNTVTLNAAASAALTPFLTGTPLATQLQIRFMSVTPTTTSQVYNILVADNTVPTAIVLTLDRVVQESTSAAASYLIYRAYIIPPVDDFLTWLSLVDQANAITISGRRLTYTATYFDVRDPQRQALGLAYYCGFYAGNQQTTGPTSSPSPTQAPWQPMYELWPHSTQGQTFYVRYRRRGTDLLNLTDQQPPGIPDGLIIQMALLHWGYPHVQANLGQFPSFKGVSWPLLYAAARGFLYGDPASGRRGSLQDAKLADDAQSPQYMVSRGHRLKGGSELTPFPIDSNYMQSHDTGRW